MYMYMCSLDRIVSPYALQVCLKCAFHVYMALYMLAQVALVSYDLASFHSRICFAAPAVNRKRIAVSLDMNDLMAKMK